MFRHVPECSEMFHVPDFIDARFSYRPLRTLDFCTVFITEHKVLLLEQHAAKRHLSSRLF